jgi:hypothetical protein
MFNAIQVLSTSLAPMPIVRTGKYLKLPRIARHMAPYIRCLGVVRPRAEGQATGRAGLPAPDARFEKETGTNRG